MCEYYLYDDEYDYYYCDMELDEDEMYDFVTGNIGDCHYFRYRNEYRYVNKKNLPHKKRKVFLLLKRYAEFT